MTSRKYKNFKWDRSEKVRDEFLKGHQALIYLALSKYPDVTDAELVFNILESKIRILELRVRRWELWKMGFIERSGRRRCSISGRPASIWRSVKSVEEE